MRSILNVNLLVSRQCFGGTLATNMSLVQLDSDTTHPCQLKINDWFVWVVGDAQIGKKKHTINAQIKCHCFGKSIYGCVCGRALMSTTPCQIRTNKLITHQTINMQQKHINSIMLIFKLGDFLIEFVFWGMHEWIRDQHNGDN